MAIRKYANFIATTLDGTITAVATSITVTDASDFPSITAPETFTLVLADGVNPKEIIKVTAVSGNVLTAVRAQESTLGFAWQDDDAVELRHTADGFERLAENRITYVNLNSGLIQGGVLSIGTDTAKFDITAGSGLVIDAYTDPANPVVTEVEWTAFDEQTTTDLATQEETHIFINSSGAIVQKSEVSVTDTRDYIHLGALEHIDNAAIDGVALKPVLAIQSQSTQVDLCASISLINLTGNVYSANGANVTLDKTAGSTFGCSINWATSQKIPNNTTDASDTALTFTPIHQDGSGGVTELANATNVDTNFYDDGSGVLAALASNRHTIHRIAYNPTDARTFVEYGQAIYNSQALAEAALATQPFIHAEHVLSETTSRSFLIVKGGATDLSNSAQAEFFEGAKSRLVGGVAGGGGGGGADVALSNLSNVAINDSLISDTDSTDDLGSTGIRWANLWVDDITVTTNITVGGTVDGRDVAADGTIVDGIPANIQDAAYVFAADGEASDTYVITLSPVPAGYVTGQMFTFTANTVNTGAATLNVNSLGAIAILKNNDVVLANGDIEAGQAVTVFYDGTSFQMLSQLGNVPAGSGDMVLAGVQTVTGAKTFGGAGDVGKLIVAGTTSGTTTLDASAVAGTTTITFPAATDTLVGKATTDTLTNKTLTSPTLTTPALGTPASGVLTNCTGTAASLTAGTVTTNANLTGDVTSSGNATTIAAKAVDVAMLADGTDGQLITWGTDAVATTVAVGTSGEFLKSQGADNVPVFAVADGRLVSIQVFTATGTWTKPAGVRLVRVTVVGAGGGSGGTGTTGAGEAAAGGGGGGGGTAIEIIDVTGTSSETATVGAGGLAALVDAAGSAGGTSSFGAFCSATGGNGGGKGNDSAAWGGSSAAAGGVGSGGDVNITGAGGGGGIRQPDFDSAIGGIGGDSYFGGAPKAIQHLSTVVGTAGKNYGSGASGSSTGSSETELVGAAGAPGIILVEEYT